MELAWTQVPNPRLKEVSRETFVFSFLGQLPSKLSAITASDISLCVQNFNTTAQAKAKLTQSDSNSKKGEVAQVNMTLSPTVCPPPRAMYCPLPLEFLYNTNRLMPYELSIYVGRVVMGSATARTY